MVLNTKGFSLVELMVVVGIISILATFVVPVYSSMTFRSREVEAKASLSSIYIAQKAFHAQYGRYHSSFQAIGWEPEGVVHFNVGFGSDGAGANAGPAQGFDLVVDTTQINSRSFCGGIGGANTPGNNCTLANLTPLVPGNVTVYADLFVAGAVINKTLYGVAQRSDPEDEGHFSVAGSVLNLLLGPQAAQAQVGMTGGPGPWFLQNLIVVYPGEMAWIITNDKNLRKVESIIPTP